MKISAIIPTLNEELHIAQAIDSVSFADEIIVIDSFSTDKTVEIAKSLQAKVILRVFDDFSSQKNYAISRTKYDWVFILDADERVTPQLETEVLEAVKKDAKNVAYWVYRSTYFMGKPLKYSGLQNDKVIRLFKKEFCKYNGKLVHEEIKANGTVGYFKNKLKHLSYKGFDAIIQKRNRYAQLQAQELYLKGIRPNFFHFLIKPLFRFIKHYFIKLGVLDGFRGVIISVIYAYTVFVRYVKLWLLRNNLKIENSKNDFPIDAVITWVDGNDEKHQQKMRPYYKGKNNWKNKKFRTRFDQVNEIEFAVKSIVKFAPYISTIFIVTDEQIPPFLENYNKSKTPNYPKIKIVDHKDIFVDYLELLPVFNSLSIETLVYKTPNLSEHFIYFNDDFLLVNKTKKSDFFINGLPVLRGKWTLFDDRNILKILNNTFLKLIGKTPKDQKFGYKRVQQNSAKLVHFKNKYLRIDHMPIPMRKSTIKKFYKENTNLEYENAKYKFRNVKQYLLQSLVTHLEIKSNKGLLKHDFQLLFLNSYKYPLFWYKHILYKAHKNNKVIFLCIQSLDKAPKNISNFIFKWLNKILDINFKSK